MPRLFRGLGKAGASDDLRPQRGSDATEAFDAFIQHDDGYHAGIETIMSRCPVPVMDLGGKTTDLIVVAKKRRSVHNYQSDKMDIGFLKLLDQVGEQFKSAFGLNDNRPFLYVEETSRRKKYELCGRNIDVSRTL